MTEEVKSKYAHVQLFFTIQRFNSGVCIYIYTPSKLYQIPVSWKTKPTGACRYFT